eukprot:SM000044S15940  [mRNA]  locus=s44:172031:173858:+ [translate_table: standard]
MKLAVLLMRSSYEAVDDLDFIAMDKFQEKSEVEQYTQQYLPLKIRYGDLTDPLYFDFITFSQFATISRAMQTGQLVFQERTGSTGEMRTVIRDERFHDNASLPKAFEHQAGSRIYTSLVEGFEGNVFGAPMPCPSGANIDYVVGSIRSLLDVLVSHGYALAATVADVNITSDAGSFQLNLEGPATLWGMRTLSNRGALTRTDFHALAIAALLRASQFGCKCTPQCTETSCLERWTISRETKR